MSDLVKGKYLSWGEMAYIVAMQRPDGSPPSIGKGASAVCLHCAGSDTDQPAIFELLSEAHARRDALNQKYGFELDFGLKFQVYKILVEVGEVVP